MSHSEIDGAPSPKRPRTKKATSEKEAVGDSSVEAESKSVEIRALVRSTVLEVLRDASAQSGAATASQETAGPSSSGEHHQLELQIYVHSYTATGIRPTGEKAGRDRSLLIRQKKKIPATRFDWERYWFRTNAEQ